MTRFDLIEFGPDDYKIDLESNHGNQGSLSDVRWLANVPFVYQAIADPNGRHFFVRPPRQGDRFPSTGPAYWGSLVHLLAYNFGWRYPWRGLSRWIADGRQVSDDLRFALIDFTWARDPHFEHFLSWSANAAGIADWAIPDIDLPEFKRPHGRWVKPTPSSVPNPYDGGTDPLHLTHHLGGLGFAPGFASPEVVLAQSSDPRGYVITDDVFTWYHALHHETRLSDRHHSGRSWRIDVIVKSVGHLGTFRKSRETNRWFAGPHRFHMMGNE